MDGRRQQPHKTAGYRQLVESYGAERVGDALLAKWISDRDAGDKWEHLMAHVQVAPRVLHPSQPRPYKYWVVLWYMSMGYKAVDVAEQMGIAVHTVKRDLQYARLSLGLVGAPLCAVVAVAIRKGVIP